MIETEPVGDLQHQLTRLRSDADENLQQFRATRRDLWRLLARTYMWWRDASQLPGFLEDEYRRANIKFYKRNDVDVNFNPIVKLVWNIRHPSASDRKAISNWTSILEILNKRYSETPEAFRHEPVGKLMALIDKEGGVSGLIEEESKRSGAQTPDKSPSTIEDAAVQEVKITGSTVEIDEPTEAALIEHTRAVFSKEERGIGTVKAAFPIPKDDENLTILIAKVTDDGQTIILDSTNDPTAIKAVLSKVRRMDLRSVSPQLLGIGDAIRVQMLPFSARPPAKSSSLRSKWFLRKFADKTDFYTTDLKSSRREGKKRRLTSSRRVHVLNNGHRIVVSGGMLRASVVVIHDLYTPIFTVDTDVFLRTVDRPFIEELFDKSAAHVWDVEVLPRLDDDDRKALVTLALKNRKGGTQKYLRFYPLDRTSIAHYIPMPHPDTVKPLWKVYVGPEWLRTAKLGWAKLWFSEIGRRNNLFDIENKRLKIAVRKEKMTIGFAGREFPLPFEADAVVSGKIPSVEFFSKDLAPVLHNIIDTDPQSPVELSGDMHCMFVRFSTHSGQMQIIIPTIDTDDDKQRDMTHFYVDGA